MAQLDIKRRLPTDDVTEVDELLQAVERADGQRPLSDHLWIDLRQGGRPGYVGLLGWQPGHDHLIAYCQVSRGNDSWALDLVVHPHHRYEMASIGPQLLAEAINVIREAGGGHVHWWVFEPTEIHASLAQSVGLHAGRNMLQMRVPLPLKETSTIATTPFRSGLDDEQWLTVNNAAFADHLEQGGWTQETLDSRKQQPWFNPHGFLLHHVDSKLAGFCWTKVHLETNPVLGEIYVIAVRPEFGGKGIGRELTIAGLNYLSRAGISTGMLHVDAENTRAVKMYRSLGFTVHHQQCAFVGDVN
ncbi:MAG: acetyltransferase MshD [Actinomycetota bacterium]|jgi:mycothiol synthase